MADHVIERLPNGEVRITCRGRTGTVSSEHLVPGKLAQLRRLARDLEIAAEVLT